MSKDAEWSKTYVFNERKKTLVLKEKFQFNEFVKMSQNIFVYFSTSSLFFRQNHLFWLWPGGWPSPLVMEWSVREAAKKSSSPNGKAIKALPPRPPPLELNGHRILFIFFLYILKIAENGFWQRFSPHNFWTKMALYLGQYCKNQVKIPTKKKFQKKLFFSLMGRAFSGGFFFGIPKIKFFLRLPFIFSFRVHIWFNFVVYLSVFEFSLQTCLSNFALTFKSSLNNSLNI